jgi:short-subunit dehydrogenase
MGLPEPRRGGAALVTGASSGIGEAIARQLVGRGYDTILVARGREKLEEVAAGLSGAETSSTAFDCDLTDAEARTRMIESIRESGSEVDLLVNCAGFATGGPFAEADPDREIDQVRLLVEAPVALTSAFLPGMVERRSGAILNVASSAGLEVVPYSGGYTGAKHHARAFSEAIHYEVKRLGISVTALCPGPVETELWATAGDHPLEKAVPKPLWITAERCAQAGLAGLEKNRAVVVPTAALRLGYGSMKFMPDGLKGRVNERFLRPGDE